MAPAISPIAELRAQLLAGDITPSSAIAGFLQKANSNAARNVYLALDQDWSIREASRIERHFSSGQRPLLYGLPISLKDCFDLQGFNTTVGTQFYARKNQPAVSDSAVAARLREQGAVITGKTHLHPLAYGITGENPDFGDCTQPENVALLTGGSTSGGAASVQEGSAIAAIGTDTGGSIRVPAALCGLAGYRASIGLARERNLWTGGVHLSQTFDTLGWIFRDLRDGPLLSEGLFGLQASKNLDAKVRIGAISEAFLHDCDENVATAWKQCNLRLAERGAQITTFEPENWDEAMSIYGPIQGSEAAAIHTSAANGDFSCFPFPISKLLERGAALSREDVEQQRARHAEFRERVDRLFEKYDFLLLPCSPMSRLEAGKDHKETRPKILRYTVPLSLAGTPVVTMPFANGAGMQLVAPRGEDAKLLAYAAEHC